MPKKGYRRDKDGCLQKKLPAKAYKILRRTKKKKR